MSPKCRLRIIVQEFLLSSEFQEIESQCRKYHCNYERCIYDCGYIEEIQYAFYKYIDKRHNLNISPNDLASYTKHVLRKNEKISSECFLSLMLPARMELAEEIDFLEWLKLNITNPLDVRKMPSSVFENQVDKYIKTTGKGEKEKRQLLKSYQHNGWEKTVLKIQKLFRLENERRTKTFSEISERYFSCNPKYKCVVLPWNDEKSQKQFNLLIDDTWSTLNEMTGDYLDIYYSEGDIGKTGYDIAKRIRELPENITDSIPCIALWENDIKQAQAINIDDLNYTQIVKESNQNNLYRDT